jgi:hypothetical protein
MSNLPKIINDIVQSINSLSAASSILVALGLVLGIVWVLKMGG